MLHCHYERGGVTQVVENLVHGLRKQPQVQRIVLVSGPRVSGLSAEKFDTVEQWGIDGFDYDDQPATVGSLWQRIDDLFQVLSRKLSAAGIRPEETVLHWHNHSLGKNTAAPGLVSKLAQHGWRILLQIHDFAEDSRPENYHRLISAVGAKTGNGIDTYLYPVAAQIHYCTLTRGDASVLIELGIPSSQVNCLPNPVIAPSPVSEAVSAVAKSDASLSRLKRVSQIFGLPSDARWCLYPVRGIRRKHVGELLLISLLTDSNQYCGLTLCPKTPIEQRSYERWRKVARVMAPQVVFDAGQHPELPFLDNLLAADFIISTSVAEGFGMAFLEPWLLRREVIARRLSNVVDDFKATGMRLPKFYDSIPIPGDKQWLTKCRRQFQDAVKAAWGRIPQVFRPCCDFQLEQGDSIDFARLIPDVQVQVLSRMQADQGFRQEVRLRSSQLCQNLRREAEPACLDHNETVVRQHYSAETSRKRLMDLYQNVLKSDLDRETQSPVRSGTAMNLINQTRPFYPCRTEGPVRGT